MSIKKNSAVSWQWIEGVVDKNEEHIIITYGDTSKEDKMIPIALIAPPKDNVFVVQFIHKGGPGAAKTQNMLKEVRKELNFYLVEKSEKDPWQYAKYHRSTAANIYSRVHWGWFPKGWKPEAC